MLDRLRCSRRRGDGLLVVAMAVTLLAVYRSETSTLVLSATEEKPRKEEM